jgi:hypothetical protein
MSITLVYDCTSANLDETVKAVGMNQAFAGYDTEIGTTAGIKWTAQQYAQHPGALHYDQEPDDSDYTADALDVETGAGVISKAGIWYTNALNNFIKAARPGQRKPAFYVSASNVTPLINGLISEGVSTGPGLIIANWSLSEASAVTEVAKASGPFPVVGIQFKNNGPFDTNVMSSAYLTTVSRPPVAYLHGIVVGSDLNTYPVKSTDRKTWSA